MKEQNEYVTMHRETERMRDNVRETARILQSDTN